MGRRAKPWWRAERDGWFVSIDGKQVNLGISDENDEAGAWAAFRERLQPRQAAISSQTVAGMVPAFLADCEARGVQPKTVRDYGFALKWLTGLKPTAGMADLDAVALANAAKARGWSDSHRHNVLTTVQQFVRWAGRGDFRIHRPQKDSRGPDSVITEEMYHAILRHTTGDFHQLIRVLWQTGARPSEIAGLTAKDVNWQTGSARLKKHKTVHKGKQRLIHFGPESLRVLREQKEKNGEGYLFLGQLQNQKRSPFNAQSICVRMQRICARAGIKVTAYCFRHTWATRALSSGVPDTHVANMLGHSSTEMIHKHYSHVCANSRLLSEIAARCE